MPEVEHQHEHGLCEADLIERAKLTSSAKEIKQLKINVNCDTNNSASNQDYEILDKVTKQDHAIQTESVNDSKEIEAEPVEAYEAVLFYETQTDESTLINNAKLASDGLRAADTYNEKLIHNVIGTELDIPQYLIDAEYNGTTDGLRARNNSYAPLELLQGATDQIEKVVCIMTSVNSNVRGTSVVEVRKQLVEYNQMPITPPDIIETRDAKDKDAIAVWKTVHADESTDVDDVLRDSDFCRLVDEVVNELAEYDLDEILSIFAGLWLYFNTIMYTYSMYLVPTEMQLVPRLIQFINCICILCLRSTGGSLDCVHLKFKVYLFFNDYDASVNNLY